MSTLYWLLWAALTIVNVALFVAAWHNLNQAKALLDRISERVA